MAQTKDDIKAAYPLPAYNYRVTVLHDGAATVVGFSQVSGLTVEYQPVTYKHGLSFAMGETIIPGMRQPLRITLKKGIARDGDYLQRWLQKSYTEPYSQGAKRDILIDLCDEQGLAVVRWTVAGALPVKLEAPTFNADGNDVAIASMELVAHELQVDYQPL